MDYTKGKLDLLNYNSVYSNYEDKEKRSVCAGCHSYYVVTPEELAHDQEIINDMYEDLKTANEDMCESCQEVVKLAESEGLDYYPCNRKCTAKGQIEQALSKAENK